MGFPGQVEEVNKLGAKCAIRIAGWQRQWFFVLAARVLSSICDQRGAQS
jgi:hypothetical protein